MKLERSFSKRLSIFIGSLGRGSWKRFTKSFWPVSCPTVGLRVQRQVPVPIVFKGIRFDEGFRADIIIENRVLFELKSVERIVPAHKKQVQTYLRLTGLKLGYLLNFGEAVLKSGITRCVNGLEEYNSQRLCVSAGEPLLNS